MQVLPWVACSCDREKLLWQPEFTSGPHGNARNSLFGQLPEIATGGYRPRLCENVRGGRSAEKATRQNALYRPCGASEGVR
ncbi:hypothetical protein BCEP27_20702 [Burkholderia cepacia]